MNKKDINKRVFDDGTLLKLEIFRKCFREWLPVFIFNPWVSNIYVYDLFAGSGRDIERNPGSPIILLEEAKGVGAQHCTRLASQEGKNIIFAFNEKEKSKVEELKDCVESFLMECKASCPLPYCNLDGKIHYRNNDFQDILKSPGFNNVLANPKAAKFVLLDQYGVSQVSEDAFGKLITSPNTDFIFFISSSTIRRFHDHPAIKQYFDTSKIDFDASRPKDCHRLIAEYFRSLIPEGKEYYLKYFTIKKGSNYYGLILGSGHTFGMEKFVNVCWEEDPMAGESNCNINDDFAPGTLFHNPDEYNVHIDVIETLTNLIKSGQITDNITGLKWVLSKGCPPKWYVEVVKNLLKKKEIEIIGNVNMRATRIHDIPKYKIRVL